jgi:hypothetical protein
MGTDLHWNEQAVEITLPAFLQNLLNRSSTPILLPAYAFFRYFPFFAKLRALMRFGLFASLFVCAAAGLGAAKLLDHFKNAKIRALAAALLALVLFDFYPGLYTEFSQIAPRPVDAWLAEQPGTGAVVQMPFAESEDQEQTYYTLFHGKPFVGGFFNAFPPPQYLRIKPLLETFPDRSSVDLLRELGVQYVVVDTNAYPDPGEIRQQIEALDIPYRTQVGDQMVFEITSPKYELPRCFCD